MYDFRSLKLASALNNTSGESNDTNNIATIYENENNYKKAIHYFKKIIGVKKIYLLLPA